MYQWFVVVGSLFAFIYGFGTGSNDVANSFASSVGSKSLSMKQAMFFILQLTMLADDDSADGVIVDDAKANFFENNPT